MNKFPTQEYLQQCFEYDSLTGLLTWKHRPLEHFKNIRGYKIFNSRNAGKLAGSLSGKENRKYVSVSIGNTEFRVHRIIWMLVTGSYPSNEIDHKNNISTDNRWINLREATSSQNNYNQRIRSNNISGFKGVGKKPDTKKYRARITINGLEKYLGSFSTPEEAYSKYCEASKQLHGQFSNTG